MIKYNMIYIVYNIISVTAICVSFWMMILLCNGLIYILSHFLEKQGPEKASIVDFEKWLSPVFPLFSGSCDSRKMRQMLDPTLVLCSN